MCGRFGLFEDANVLARGFGARVPKDFAPRYNIAAGASYFCIRFQMRPTSTINTPPSRRSDSLFIALIHPCRAVEVRPRPSSISRSGYILCRSRIIGIQRRGCRNMCADNVYPRINVCFPEILLCELQHVGMVVASFTVPAIHYIAYSLGPLVFNAINDIVFHNNPPGRLLPRGTNHIINFTLDGCDRSGSARFEPCIIRQK